MKEYPKEHKSIVDALTNGQFILYTNPLHSVIVQNDNEYIRFFKATFNFNLIIRNEFIYLLSEDTQENDTRNFVIFLGLLCRELNVSGKSFKDEIEYKSFYVDEVDRMLSASPKKDLYEIILNSTNRSIQAFLRRWKDRNVIEFKNSNQTEFKFTPAVKLFFEYAMLIADNQLKKAETDNSVSES